ncbi:MAG: T9SS type A sorting domain-containing protein [Cyclobacteriaceae bacterium]|nr:T9SS type A sorting domain-containing protein [Cyclobacteriaceae bacterium]
MKKSYLLLVLVLITGQVWSKESIDPTITPALFRPSDEITVVYDVTGTPLANLPEAWVWVWIPGLNIDANSNVNPASSNPTKAAPAKCTKSVSDGKTLFTVVFTPSDFFDTDISDATQLGILLKGNDWSNGQTTDYLASIWDGGFELKLTAPSKRHLFVDPGNSIGIAAETPVAADFSLYVDDVLVDQAQGTAYSFEYVVPGTPDAAVLKLVADTGDDTDEQSFQYLLRQASPEVPRPAGIIPGINYAMGDDTRVTLCLWAPGKSNVYVLGDFTEWELRSDFLMNRDGEYFWIEIQGLTAGVEYGYQFLIDEAIYVADPYADKILYPEDAYIPASVYPSLKSYPAAALHNEWYFNRVAVFATGVTPYEWQTSNYVKPEKDEIVIYELLIRDFFAAGDRSYQNLIDTISYFKRLGVNAIELMPVMEFNGNEGWGYNPTFMFAPDKYYGTRDMLKAFIDRCHQEGIAVILDIVMNHHDLPNPYVMMDFDFGTMKPEADNKWFNTDATHPFNVFFDMNHESAYTQAYLDTVTHYWLNEYKVDGFRFDLSKGFTQKNNPSNVSAWSAYDASRIALLKRMADAIWEHTPDAWIILEHFAANEEEKELAEYRVDEGKGMLLWGNLNHAFNQNTMGYAEESDISWIDYQERGWSVPHVVGYMESHDEERIMYKNLAFGNASGSYSVKDLAIALRRTEGAALLFYLTPGPRMLWQFGELGYDHSINRCEDGSISDACRLSPKPVGWSLREEATRKRLLNRTADLMRLRREYPVFTEGTASYGGGNTLLKQVALKNNPYTSTPTGPDEMNAQLVVNFGVNPEGIVVEFPHTGTWYDYYAYGAPLEVTSTATVINLQPGEYRLYTDVLIENPLVTAVQDERNQRVTVFPNPVRSHVSVSSDNDIITGVTVRNMLGQRTTLRREGGQWNLEGLAPGLYIAEIQTLRQRYVVKLVKEP